MIVAALAAAIAFFAYRMDRNAAKQREALERTAREKEHREILSNTITTAAGVRSRAAALAYRYIKLNDVMILRPQSGSQDEETWRKRIQDRANFYKELAEDAFSTVERAMKELREASRNEDVELRLHEQRIQRAATMGEEAEALIVDAEKKVAALPKLSE